MGLLESMGVTNVEYSDAKIIFDAYDTNSSGSFDIDEFVTAIGNGFV